jgi:hypothetical protein
MEINCVYLTSQARPFAAIALLAFFATVGPANATTFVPSQTIGAGTRIACVLDEHLDSSNLKYGDTFKLRVVDTAHPVLNGSEIIGYITDVRQAGGTTRARVGFMLTTIQLPGGKKKSISATVLSKRVVPINPGAQQASRQQLSPMAGVPHGTVTPGPIAWQMNIGNGPSNVNTTSTPNLGGYVYATSAHEPIVVNAGTPVTVQLTESLTVP